MSSDILVIPYWVQAAAESPRVVPKTQSVFRLPESEPTTIASIRVRRVDWLATQMLAEQAWAAFQIWDRTQRGIFPKTLSKSSAERSWERCSGHRVARLGGRAPNSRGTVSLRDSSRTSMLFLRPNQSMKPHAVPELPPPNCACTQGGKLVAFASERILDMTRKVISQAEPYRRVRSRPILTD